MALLELQRKTSPGGTDWLLGFLYTKIPKLCCHQPHVATYNTFNLIKVIYD